MMELGSQQISDCNFLPSCMFYNIVYCVEELAHTYTRAHNALSDISAGQCGWSTLNSSHAYVFSQEISHKTERNSIPGNT